MQRDEGIGELKIRFELVLCALGIPYMRKEYGDFSAGGLHVYRRFD